MFQTTNQIEVNLPSMVAQITSQLALLEFHDNFCLQKHKFGACLPLHHCLPQYGCATLHVWSHVG